MEHERYGRCPECNQLNTNYGWCKSCSVSHFQNAFSTWTSGNKEIDYFIQNTQIQAWRWEVIPMEKKFRILRNASEIHTEFAPSSV